MVFHGPSFLVVTSQVVPSPFFTKKDGVLVPHKPSNEKTKRYGVTPNCHNGNSINQKNMNESSRRERLTPVLSHHRTYGSVYGGSIKIIDASLYNFRE